MATKTIIDTFESSPINLDDPASNAVAVVVNTALSFISRRLYIGVTGDVVVAMRGVGNAGITYKAVPAGTYLHVRASKVLTGTTATNIVAEW